MTTQINQGYKIGLLALFALAILYYGCFFLKGHNIFSTHNHYKVFYSINRELSVAAPIKINGHVVGIITKLELNPKQNYSTLLTIEVNKKFPLTDQSKVLLNNSNIITEGNILELELHEGTPLTKDSIIMGQLHPQFNELNLRGMTTQVQVITTNLIKTTEGINVILKNLEKTSHALGTSVNMLQKNITAITENILAISAPLADPIKGMPTIVPSIHKIVSGLASIPFRDISSSTTRMLNNTELLLQNITNSHGTLGLLINNNKLYNNLNNSFENFNTLCFDIRKQPSRYVNFSLFRNNKKRSIRN